MSPAAAGASVMVPAALLLALVTRIERLEEEIAALRRNSSDLPFDNNQAERDLHMKKTRQKTRGCFRSMLHARAFANRRSVIASAKKSSKDVPEILHFHHE